MEADSAGTMEVPGRPDEVTSIDQTVLYCTPCQLDDQQNNADGFCQTCKEYLCKLCVSHHRRLRMTRHHVILDKINMPRDASIPGAPNTLCTDACSIHNDKVIEYYCHGDGVFGCTVCMTVKHKACEVDYIPDVVKPVNEDPEYKSVRSNLDEIRNILDEYKVMTATEQENIAEDHANICQGVADFHASIVEKADQMKENMNQLAEHLKTKSEENLKEKRSSHDKLEGRLTDINLLFNDCESNLAKIFILTKTEKVNIDHLKNECVALKESGTTARYAFKPNHEAVDAILQETSLGDIKPLENNERKSTDIAEEDGRSSENTNASASEMACEIKDMNFFSVKMKILGRISCSFVDETKSVITGLLVLPGGTLLAAEYASFKLKMFDVNSRGKGKFKLSLALKGHPWSLTSLTNGEVAVCVREKQLVQIVSTLDGLSPVRDFKVNGDSMGICYIAGTLVVSYQNPGKIEIFNQEGAALKVVNKSRGEEIFDNPIRVITNPFTDDQSVYVSDYGANSIIKMTSSGRIISTFQDPNIKHPEDITFLDAKHLAVICQSVCFVLKEVGGQVDIVDWLNIESTALSLAFCSVTKRLFLGDQEETSLIYEYELYQ